MHLTVILPTYNEAENLPKLIPMLLALSLPVELSVLVVDDNSPDGTGQVADDLAIQYPNRVKVLHRPGKQGLGQAYRAGFEQALTDGADFILQMDSDFSHQPEYIPAMVEAIQTADLVAGSRLTKGGSVDENWAWWRKLLTRFANNVYVRVILNMPLNDTTGGFRLWRRATLIGMDFKNRIRSNGYVFQVEIAYITFKLGYKMVEIPIHFPDRQLGKSKMSFRIQAEAALRVLQVWQCHHQLTVADRVIEPNAQPTP